MSPQKPETDIQATPPPRSGLWRFAGLLRLTTLAMAFVYSASFAAIWVAAIMGNTMPAFDLMDIENDAPLSAWQIAYGCATSALVCGAMIIIALAANRFLKTSYRKGFFDATIAQTLRRIGYGLGLFYLGVVLIDNSLSWMLTYNLPADQREPIDWVIFDPNLIALLAAFILILLSDAITQARNIQADNAQFI